MENRLEGPSGSAAIDSSNIGFKLLKKHGWKEGTGLGISEQGRLEPVEAHWKNNKRGLGADKGKNKSLHTNNSAALDDKNEQEGVGPSKKSKKLSKRMRKVQEFERQLQEKEFERLYFRDFWPDNV